MFCFFERRNFLNSNDLDFLHIVSLNTFLLTKFEYSIGNFMVYLLCIKTLIATNIVEARNIVAHLYEVSVSLELTVNDLLLSITIMRTLNEFSQFLLGVLKQLTPQRCSQDRVGNSKT